MGDIKTNADRACDLARLSVRIMTAAIRKADDGQEAQIAAEFAERNVGFLAKALSLFKKGKGLTKVWNILSLWSFIKGDLSDPFEEEREALKAFCRKWVPLSGLTLTEEETELIN